MDNGPMVIDRPDYQPGREVRNDRFHEVYRSSTGTGKAVRGTRPEFPIKGERWDHERGGSY